MIDTATPAAEVRDLTNHAYHADTTHDSRSSVLLFEKSPKGYHRQRVLKIVAPDPETEAMRKGSATHTGILEPEKFAASVRIIPKEVLSSDGAKRGKAWDAWSFQNGGFIHLKQAEWDAVQWMIDAVQQNPEARELLQACSVYEHSIFWTDEQGHPRKARPDGIDELGGVMPDVKTTCDPGTNWWYRARDFGVNRQAAWYQDACEAYYGIVPKPVYIVVGNEEPYDCFVWTLPQPWIDLGRQQNREALERLRECRTGARPWFPEGHGERRELPVPAYVYESAPDEIPGEVARYEY